MVRVRTHCARTYLIMARASTSATASVACRHSGHLSALLHIAILNDDADPRRTRIRDVGVPGDSYLASRLEAHFLFCWFAETQIIHSKSKPMRSAALALALPPDILRSCGPHLSREVDCVAFAQIHAVRPSGEGQQRSMLRALPDRIAALRN